MPRSIWLWLWLVVWVWALTAVIKAQQPLQPAGALHGHIQRFSIHGQADCSDVGEMYTDSVRRLEKVSRLVQCAAMKCFCVWHGLWVFTARSNFKSTFRIENSGRSSMKNPGNICESRRINWKYFQLGSIRHVGNSNDSEPGLSLYRDTDLYGGELYVGGSSATAAAAGPTTAYAYTSLSLPVPRTFHSYGLSGSKRWMVFPNVNFTGNGTCLSAAPGTASASASAASAPAKGDVEIRSETKVRLVVGSIQSWCSSSSTISKRRKLSEPAQLIVLYKKESAAAASKPESEPDVNTTKTKPKAKELRLVFDGPELKLPSAAPFTHFAVLGPQSWTIYSGPEFNGGCVCLHPLGHVSVSDRSRGRRRFEVESRPASGTGGSTTTNYGHTLPKDPDPPPDFRMIGSIRQGCDPATCDPAQSQLFLGGGGSSESDDDEDYEGADYSEEAGQVQAGPEIVAKAEDDTSVTATGNKLNGSDSDNRRGGNESVSVDDSSGSGGPPPPRIRIGSKINVKGQRGRGQGLQEPGLFNRSKTTTEAVKWTSASIQQRVGFNFDPVNCGRGSFLVPVRHRYYDADKGIMRRYGYEDKLAWRGRLPRIPRETVSRVPIPPYAPKTNWTQKKALFGQNDYIDILGSADIHPVRIAYGVPRWLRGFAGNEYQMLLRKRAVFGPKMKSANPESYHSLHKRLKYLGKALNFKRKTRFDHRK